MDAIHRMHVHWIACGTRMTHSEMAPEPIALAWAAGCLFFTRVSRDETQLAA
jgi:hypothetical protein